MSKLTGSKKATQFTESVIREMTRLNQIHGGVNLSQGFPDFPAPQAIKDAACAAINADVNQYAVTWGARPLREAIAREFTKRYGLEMVATLCRKWDAIAISDEIYEHIIYDGHQHVPIATLEGMADRTVTLNGLSKTYSVTGWRVGWTISPPSLTGAIRKVHDFLTVGAPAPLQEAGAVALGFAEDYYSKLAAHYQTRRDALVEILQRHHFTTYRPSGAY